jgi:hypothetical protein
MKRVTIHITEKQHEWLKLMSAVRGLKVSEIVRRALDDYFKMGGKRR